METGLDFQTTTTDIFPLALHSFCFYRKSFEYCNLHSLPYSYHMGDWLPSIQSQSLIHRMKESESQLLVLQQPLKLGQVTLNCSYTGAGENANCTALHYAATTTQRIILQPMHINMKMRIDIMASRLVVLLQWTNYLVVYRDQRLHRDNHNSNSSRGNN